MLTSWLTQSLKRPILSLILTALLLGAGLLAASSLPLDAIPDVSTVQVTVLTEAPGLSPTEVEQMVTFPLETALNGTPGSLELRSVSRAGLSAITLIFKDSVDPWFARQLTLERLRPVEAILPPGVANPELAPMSTAIGEIYQFVVKSPNHTPLQLRTLLDWEIIPKLRSVSGVIEVNAMGGALKQYQILLDPLRLQAYRLSLPEIQASLKRANGVVGGGYLEEHAEALALRGVGLAKDERELAEISLKTGENGAPILVKHLGQVQVGEALPYGAVTQNGETEVVLGTVMMIFGGNSKTVVEKVKKRLLEIQADLPTGVTLETMYDRAELITRTIKTVFKNLLEGALIVFLLLALTLGTLRGAFAVILGIPVAMSVALISMHLFRITGDLMSLGAIDFGFLVDGPIIILEALCSQQILHHSSHQRDNPEDYRHLILRLLKPVGFSITIIMLVYLPLLSLQGTEGKMFRPMTLTMAAALLGAVIYTLVLFPGILRALLPPQTVTHPAWLTSLQNLYARALPWALAQRKFLSLGALLAFSLSLVILLSHGADFVPRLEEGDLVLAVKRAPSIGLLQAKQLDLQVENILKRFPEVIHSLGLNGRGEIATNPIGFDSTDIWVKLQPKEKWQTAEDFDSLATILKNTLESEVPGTFISVSQPIEDRTNELLSGSRADVQIQLSGPDLNELRRLSEKIGDIVKHIPGSGDVRVERLLGLPILEVKPDRLSLSRYNIDMEEALATVEAMRMGVKVGSIYEGQKRFEVRLLLPPQGTTTEALGDLFVATKTGVLVPLAEIANIHKYEGPAQIRRENLERNVRIDVNIRGRDLMSWVSEAQKAVEKNISLPATYKLKWGGQFANFTRATSRLALVVPLVLGIILTLLYVLFQDLLYASAIFANVPLAVIGGVLGLYLRHLPFSVPAAVGFIALFGVSVLNGVLIATTVKKNLQAQSGATKDIYLALKDGAMHNLRAVLTTALVAALGFLPMGLSTATGSEIQRPLATVVIFGILVSTCLTLFIFPGILYLLLQRRYR